LVVTFVALALGEAEALDEVLPYEYGLPDELELVAATPLPALAEPADDELELLPHAAASRPTAITIGIPA
jgi:hypothetical protein